MRACTEGCLLHDSLPVTISDAFSLLATGVYPTHRQLVATQQQRLIKADSPHSSQTNIERGVAKHEWRQLAPRPDDLPLQRRSARMDANASWASPDLPRCGHAFQPVAHCALMHSIGVCSPRRNGPGVISLGVWTRQTRPHLRTRPYLQHGVVCARSSRRNAMCGGTRTH